MIQCGQCGAVHPPNTLFCDECGNRLAGSPPADPPPPAAPAQQAETPQATAGDAPLRLSLFAAGNSPVYDRVLDAEAVVGRTDSATRAHPDVDLAPLEGAARGVSRRHARFMREGAKVVLEDLNSLNGTFVGGNRLPARHAFEIRSGDEVQFGKVVLRIQLEPA
jgi:pSer/pThr/pTyr-binding forkhead associated (FHA) protein